MKYEIGPEFVSEFNRLRSIVDSQPWLSHASRSAGEDGTPGKETVSLKIIAPVTGNQSGRYTANLFFGYTNKSPGGTLVDSDLGTAGSNVVEVWNLYEIDANGTPQKTAGLMAGDTVQGVLKGYNASTGQPIYHVSISTLIVGTYCPTQNPIYLDTQHVTEISFHSDDFQMSSPVADPHRMHILWGGFTVIGNAYTSAQQVCNTKIIKLFDTGQASVPATSTLVEPAPVSNKYNLKWHLTNSQETDPCAGCQDPPEKPTANLSGYIYINPCDYGYMHIQDCTTTIDNTFQIVQFHKGFKVTPTGMCTDAIPNRAVIDLDFTSLSGYLVIDNSGSCGMTINLITHTECVITGISISGDCTSGYTITTTKKEIVVLGAS